jgi:two-component system response regulator YesN
MLQVIDTYFPEAHTVAHLLEDRIVMVVPSDQPEASDATFEISLRSMKVRMEDYIQQTVSVAVGSRISTVHELHHSYTAAEGALEQKFVRGKGQIIHHSTVHGTHATDQLEEETLKALQQAVRNLSRRQAAAALKEAVASIEPGPRLKEVYKLSGSRILAALEGVMADQEMELPELSEIGEVIERSETVAELETWYFTVLNKIFHQVELHKRSKNIDYLEKIERILEEQYSNPYLQIADVAEEFQLSPTYFGRFFHELTGLNFTNYVNEVRLKHASEMLTTTDLSVNDVAERAGFNSTQYFIRVFKKKFHITPRTYRQRETEKQNV